MENYSAYSDIVLKDLSERFKQLTFKFLIQDIGVKISVFVVHGSCSNLEEGNNWRIISEEIALKFQNKIISKDDKWNIYIIYACSDKVDKELKAKIENDKFSSRKIVEDNQTKELSDEIVNNLIVKHITNTDLVNIVNNTDENIEKSYHPQKAEVWDLIPKNESVMRNKGLQNTIIEQLKKINYEN